MKSVLLTIVLATVGTVRDEGHCLDKRGLVLTEAEATELVGLAARAEKSAIRIAALKSGLAASKRELAAALEAQAYALGVECPVTKCECDRWTMGLAGVGVGLLSCGSFWIGAEL